MENKIKKLYNRKTNKVEGKKLNVYFPLFEQKEKIMMDKAREIALKTLYKIDKEEA